MNQKQNNHRGRGRNHGKRNHSHSRGPGNHSEVKVVGNAKQQLDRYKSLARDALQIGDHALSENYLQHADHFQRLLNERSEKNHSNNDNRNGSRRHSPQKQPQRENESLIKSDGEEPTDNGMETIETPVEEAPDKTIEVSVEPAEEKAEKPKRTRKAAPRKPKAKKAEANA